MPYACVVGGWRPVVAVTRGRSEGGKDAGPRCRDGRSQGVVSDNLSQLQALLRVLCCLLHTAAAAVTDLVP